MAAFISEITIEDVKRAADIVDVISEFVLLKKQGINYIGLCPFHSEKTPSFTVSQEKQIFHCFGCGNGGNVFRFLMKHESFSFPEAVRHLAQRYGIDIPIQSMSPGQKRQKDERETLFEINQQAMDFFYSCLKSNTTGNRAMAYLNKRRISEEIIDYFRLGYASDGWETLVNFFSKKGISHASVEKAGLIISRRDGSGYYDRFRNRIIFPIFDVNKKVIGFGGRSMDDTLPKYLNSPETPVYHKSRSLYGLYHSKKKCRENGTVYLVEGYFDFLSLYQTGIQNVVATLGTALTSEHLRLLKGYAGRIILVYDSDDAGIKAALRSVDIFRKEGVEANIVILPSGYDPDAFILEFGPEAFIETGVKALEIIPFLIDSAIKKHGISIEGKIRIIEDLKDPLSTLENRTARSLYVKSLAEAIDVDERAIWDKIRENSKHDGINGQRAYPTKSVSSPYRSRAGNHRISNGAAGKGFEDEGKRFERLILSMVLQFPEILPEVNQRGILDCFKDNTLRSIGYFILEHFPRCNHNVSEMVERIDDEAKRNIMTHLAIGDYPWDREGCLSLLTQFELIRSRQKNNLIQKIKAAEDSQDYDLLVKLLKDKQLQAIKVNLTQTNNSDKINGGC